MKIRLFRGLCETESRLIVRPVPRDIARNLIPHGYGAYIREFGDHELVVLIVGRELFRIPLD